MTDDAEGKKPVPLAQIVEAIEDIQYGYVQITVQNSEVVQIDKTEKIRLDKKGNARPKGGDT